VQPPDSQLSQSKSMLGNATVVTAAGGLRAAVAGIAIPAARGHAVGAAAVSARLAGPYHDIRKGLLKVDPQGLVKVRQSIVDPREPLQSRGQSRLTL